MIIDDLFGLAKENKASDLHLKANAHPTFRIDGELLPQEQLALLSADDTSHIFESITTEEQKGNFEQELELDFTYESPIVGRARVNAHFQRGSIALVLRIIGDHIPSIEELGLPAICRDLVMGQHGLVIVTGPTGSGKSTTLAAMLRYLNENSKKKVVTIEDPIEYIYHDHSCTIVQREIGTDTKSFSVALKHALRQDPDVILVGEMRDLETISSALTAAETGHLVLGTLHTPSASQAVDRIIDVFPPHQQQQVRTQLSTTLAGVLYQILLPKLSGQGRAAAIEVLLSTTAVRNLIREGKTYQIPNVIATGSQIGMCTMDDALMKLESAMIISKEEVEKHRSE